MKPTVGRTVLFVVDSWCAGLANARLQDDPLTRGNVTERGQVLPLIVTRVLLEGAVNGQLLLDGNFTQFIGTAYHDQIGKAHGTWHWPEKEAS